MSPISARRPHRSGSPDRRSEPAVPPVGAADDAPGDDRPVRRDPDGRRRRRLAAGLAAAGLVVLGMTVAAVEREQSGPLPVPDDARVVDPPEAVDDQGMRVVGHGPEETAVGRYGTQAPV